MPLPIDIQPLPTQKLTATLDNQRYALTLRTITNGDTIADVAINDITVIEGIRVIPDRLVSPFPYMEGSGGNFLVDTGDGETLPDYTLFGTLQRLLYFTAAELVNGRA